MPDHYDPIGDDAHTDRAERAQVVAWLRVQAARPVYGEDTIGTHALSLAADAIERGDHHELALTTEGA